MHWDCQTEHSATLGRSPVLPRKAAATDARSRAKSSAEPAAAGGWQGCGGRAGADRLAILVSIIPRYCGAREFFPAQKAGSRESGGKSGRHRLAKYDLAIIGSGPGGYVAAIRAGQLGLKTVVVEKDAPLGGTCLLIGCIPTKVLLHHADLYEHFKRASEFGFEVKDVTVNWPAILARKDKIILKHSKGIEFLFKKNKVERVQGFGRLAGPGRVSVEKDGKTTEIEAANILLATGSDARTLP